MPLPIKIIQTKDEITFLYETFHGFRVIPTDGRKHPDDIDPSFLGDSVAHWEGDTLVVDVIGFNDKTWLGAGGATLHTDALHVIERYTRVDYDTITYEVTIDDPKAFTKTWNPPRHRFCRCGPVSACTNTSASRTTRTSCVSRNCLKNESLFRRQPQEEPKK